MTNYNDLTDFEINKRVAVADGWESPTEYADTDEDSEICIHPKGRPSRYHYVDYCNSWSDMGPIIEREGIIVDGYGWAGRKNPVVECSNPKPPRAAAIVYLMIKEGK